MPWILKSGLQRRQHFQNLPVKSFKSTPNIFFWPFLHEVGESSTDPDAVISLALVDSRTSFLGCEPMNGKAQFDLATKEVIAFCHQALGYNDVMLRCDNEPSVLQLLRLVVQARQQMCLQTQACTPSAYQHGNALAENAIQRIRSLAGSLMHFTVGLQSIPTMHFGLGACVMQRGFWTGSTHTKG